MTEQKKGASLNPVDFIAGGLMDDVDVTFKNVRFEMCDYNGTQETPSPALGADLITGAEQANEKAYRQHWSCGSAESWEPSPDGSQCVAIGKDTEFRKSSNVFLFVGSLQQAGFPMERLNEGNCTVLEGMVAHVKRVDQPTRSNLNQPTTRRGRDGKEYAKDNKVLCVTKIISLADEKKGAKKAAAGNAKGPEGTGSNANLDEKAKIVMMTLIGQGGGHTSKKELPTKGFQAIPQDDKDKNKIFTLLFKDEWIKSNGFVIAEDGTITVA